jgi:hypothetical protein
MIRKLLPVFVSLLVDGNQFRNLSSKVRISSRIYSIFDRLIPKQKLQDKMPKLKAKGVVYDGVTGEVVDCLFCRIHARTEPGTIVYEDKDFVVFETINPATALHLLVTPRRHIKDVSILKGPKDAELVRELVAVGKRAIATVIDRHGGSFSDYGGRNAARGGGEYQGSSLSLREFSQEAQRIAHDARFCFHVPPWNSIDHLHLHAIARLNTMGFKSSIKYMPNTYYCQTADSLIATLQAQKSVVSSVTNKLRARQSSEMEREGAIAAREDEDTTGNKNKEKKNIVIAAKRQEEGDKEMDTNIVETVDKIGMEDADETKSKKENGNSTEPRSRI